MLRRKSAFFCIREWVFACMLIESSDDVSGLTHGAVSPAELDLTPIVMQNQTMVALSVL